MNAWIGGFQNILNNMTVVNFNWTLHALLFLHTQKVIANQKAKAAKIGGNEDENENEDDGVEVERNNL